MRAVQALHLMGIIVMMRIVRGMGYLTAAIVEIGGLSGCGALGIGVERHIELT